MNKIFNFKEFRYRLRINNRLISRNIKTVLYIKESISALAPGTLSGTLSPLKFKQSVFLSI